MNPNNEPYCYEVTRKYPSGIEQTCGRFITVEAAFKKLSELFILTKDNVIITAVNSDGTKKLIFF